MTLPDGLQVRDVDRDTDLPRVVELLRTCDLYDSGITDASEAWLQDDWRSSSIKGAMVAETDGGEVVGYLSLESLDPAAMVTMYFPLAPSVRPTSRESWTAFCAERVEELAGSKAIRYAVVAAEEAAGPALETTGYHFARVFWHMERDVDDTLRHQRTHQLHESVDDQTCQSGHHKRRIRARIDEKPPHQAGVQRLTGHFVVVHIGNVVAGATCSAVGHVGKPDVVRALRG